MSISACTSLTRNYTNDAVIGTLGSYPRQQGSSSSGRGYHTQKEHWPRTEKPYQRRPSHKNRKSRSAPSRTQLNSSLLRLPRATSSNVGRNFCRQQNTSVHKALSRLLLRAVNQNHNSCHISMRSPQGPACKQGYTSNPSRNWNVRGTRYPH